MTDVCVLCNSKINGTLMRTDRRYARVRNLLRAPEIPRLKSGGIALCHHCQRSVAFSGGFNNLVQRALELQLRNNGSSAHWSVKPRLALSHHTKAAE